jgi:branched-chain amino acid transport system substrate-binding protein
VKAALEDLRTPVQGSIKLYDRPFSKTGREALSGSSFLWSRWKDGAVGVTSDDVIKALKPEHFIQG